MVLAVAVAMKWLWKWSDFTVGSNEGRRLTQNNKNFPYNPAVSGSFACQLAIGKMT